MSRLLREPLFHFLLIGAGLFVVFALKTGKPAADPAGNEITVGAQQIEPLVAGFTRTWQRPPNPVELEGLVRDFIKEEVLYREALGMGLEKNDTVIRRRMAQKMEFLTGDVAALATPDEAALTKYFEANAAQYAEPPRVSFTHVYYSREKRGEKAEVDAKAGLAAVTQRPEAAMDLGDPSLLPGGFETTPLRDIRSQFGDAFAAALAALPLNQWQGPVASSYGVHLVQITARTEPERQDLARVRDAVVRDYQNTQREDLNLRTMEELKKRYRITVDEAALQKAASGIPTEAAR